MPPTVTTPSPVQPAGTTPNPPAPLTINLPTEAVLTPLDIFSQITNQIVKEQERIIGNLAIEQASMVAGVNIDPVTNKVSVVGNGSQVVDDLIAQYSNFFGSAAIEVCRDAASPYLSRLTDTQMPSMLKAQA